jgi:hypothetical protein
MAASRARGGAYQWFRHRARHSRMATLGSVRCRPMGGAVGHLQRPANPTVVSDGGPLLRNCHTHNAMLDVCVPRRPQALAPSGCVARPTWRRTSGAATPSLCWLLTRSLGFSGSRSRMRVTPTRRWPARAPPQVNSFPSAFQHGPPQGIVPLLPRPGEAATRLLHPTPSVYAISARIHEIVR